jgi:hypothetical protein
MYFIQTKTKQMINPISTKERDNKANTYWICTIFDPKDSTEEAETITEEPEFSDPENTGCGGFSWTRIEKTNRIP